MDKEEVEWLKSNLSKLDQNRSLEGLFFRNKCSKCGSYIDVFVKLDIQARFKGWFCNNCGHKNYW